MNKEMELKDLSASRQMDNSQLGLNQSRDGEMSPGLNTSIEKKEVKGKEGVSPSQKGIRKIGKSVTSILDVGIDVVGLGGIFTKKFKKRKGNIKETQTEKEIRKTKIHMRRIDSLAGVIVIVVGIIAYFENEEFYKAKPTCEGCLSEHNVETFATYAMRSSIIICTVVINILIYLHYRFFLRLLKLRRLRLNEDTLYTAGLVKNLLFEIVFVSIVAVPGANLDLSGSVFGADYTFSLDGAIFVIQLGKINLILRLYQQYSSWTSDKAIKVCKKFKCKADVYFAIKAELKRRPYVMISFLMTATIVVLGLAIRRFEISYEFNKSNLSSFTFDYTWNAFWLIIITMTTVGFGEGFPSTVLGRVIGIIACILGMLLVSLMVVSLTISSEFNSEQKKTFFMIKRHYANEKAKERAANVVKQVFLIRSLVKEENKDIARTFKEVTKLKNSVRKFRTEFRYSLIDLQGLII